jgi:hypothetical protein
MQLHKPHATRHYRARLIAWTLGLLAWLTSVFSADRAPSRRHMRRRYGFISLDRLARDTALLILIRAAELGRMRRYCADPFLKRTRGRDVAPPHLVRSLIGSRLRRAFKHRSFSARVAILSGALRRLDAWAGRFIGRMRRGMTRLWAQPAKPRPAAPLTMLAAPAAFFADSS